MSVFCKWTYKTGIPVLRKHKWFPQLFWLSGDAALLISFRVNNFLKPLPNHFISNYRQIKKFRRHNHIIPSTRNGNLYLWQCGMQRPLPWGPREAARDVSPYVSKHLSGWGWKGEEGIAFMCVKGKSQKYLSYAKKCQLLGTVNNSDRILACPSPSHSVLSVLIWPYEEDRIYTHFIDKETETAQAGG